MDFLTSCKGSTYGDHDISDLFFYIDCTLLNLQRMY
jgi:hypothetical protein